MTRVSKTVWALALCVVLVLAGQGMAAVRGASAATGKMVLCIGSGAVSVYVDARGRPTQAPHHCPECLPSLLALISDAAIAEPPSPLPRVLDGAAKAALWRAALLRVYGARAPPDLV